MKIAPLLILAITLLSCGTNPTNVKSVNKYAHGFEIFKHNNGYDINIILPTYDNNTVAYTFNLTHNGTIQSAQTIESQSVGIPLKRVVVISPAHLAMISELDEVNSVIGISELKYINDKQLLESSQTRNIAEIGYDYSLDVKHLIELKPDAIFINDMPQGIPMIFRELTKIGIPVIPLSEYYENNPLARLEWLRLISCFYDKLEKADSIIDSKIEQYNNHKQLVSKIDIKPKVLVGMPLRNLWSVHGGGTVTAALINDAGGDYLYQHLEQNLSYRLEIEEVINHSKQADIWIDLGFVDSINSIIETDERCKSIKAYKMGAVFNNNKRQSIAGGNDFMESGIVNPEIALKDLITIFHPNIFADNKTVYYQRLY